MPCAWGGGLFWFDYFFLVFFFVFFYVPPSIHILLEIFTSISRELGGPGAAPSCPGAPQVAGGLPTHCPPTPPSSWLLTSFPRPPHPPKFGSLPPLAPGRSQPPQTLIWGKTQLSWEALKTGTRNC